MLLSLQRFPLQLLAYLTHHITRHRQEDQDEQCQLPTDGDHAGQVDQDQDRVLKQHVQRAHDGGLDLVHVARDPGDNIPLPLLREETQGQLRDLPVDLVTDVTHHARPDRDHRIERQIHGGYLQEGSHDQENTQHDQRKRAATYLYQLRDEPKEIIRTEVG